MKPYLQTLAVVIMCFCFFTWGRYSASEHECINEEYKEAYLNHILLCDTLHKFCFKIGN